MTELPQNWIESELEKCVIHKKGTKPKNLYNVPAVNYVPYIDIKAFEKHIIEQYTEKTTAKLTEQNNILVVWDGARAGFVGIAPCEGAIGSTLVEIKTNNENIENKYLYYFLSSKYQYINSKPRGSGTPHVDPTLYWKLMVPLPPLNEQKRIVKKLDSIMPKVDEVNSRLDRIPQILKRAHQSILNQAITGELTKDWRKEHIINKPSDLNERLEQERKQICEINGKKYKKAVFIDIDKNKTKGVDYLYQIPESWEWVSIGQVLWDISDGPHFSPKYVDETTGIPFISARNVQYSKIDFSTAKYISKEDYELFSKRGVAEYNDVLLTKGGTTGIATVVDIKKKFGIWVHIALLKYLKKYINPYYLRDALSSHFMYKQSQAQTHGVGNQDLGLTRIVYMALPLPPLEEQEEIVKRVKEAFEKLDKIEEQYKKAKSYTDKLTQSILHKAFKGDLVPQDPNDKPVEI